MRLYVRSLGLLQLESEIQLAVILGELIYQELRIGTIKE